MLVPELLSVWAKHQEWKWSGSGGDLSEQACTLCVFTEKLHVFSVLNTFLKASWVIRESW